MSSSAVSGTLPCEMIEGAVCIIEESVFGKSEMLGYVRTMCCYILKTFRAISVVTNRQHSQH